VDSFQDTSPVKSPSKTQRSITGRSKKPNMEEMFPPISHAESHALQQGLSQAFNSSAPSQVAPLRGLNLKPEDAEWNETSFDEPPSLEVGQSVGESMEEFSVAANLLEVEEEEPLDTTDPRDYVCSRLCCL
jgi:hypothetical protein